MVILFLDSLANLRRPVHTRKFIFRIILATGTAQREGLGGALAPPLFWKNENRLNGK